ncbi:MAG: glycosyltransferase family 1 protein [Candidatus Buchananbacteria bacterium]|nr:glycosyltransferase family 1 protein [Candidatus Buchananbacteria bacterium]
MIIGIDASRANRPNKTGVEWYSYHLIQELKKITPENIQVLLYANEKLVNGLEDCPANFKEKILSWPPKYLWTQIRLAWELSLHAPDVLFVPAHTIPFWPIRRRTKVYVVVHDVGFKRYPDLYKKIQFYYHDLTMKAIKRRADRIITISDFSKKEIMDLYQVNADKIIVIPLGYDENKYNTGVLENKNVLDKYKISQPYILYVGRLEKKKNIGNIVKSFAYAKTSNPDLKLALAGQAGNEYEAIAKIISSHKLENEILLPGYIDEDDLPAVMKMAEIFLFPTLYEGFGLPILQAMALGTPVVASDIEPHKSVAGQAAALADPKNPENIAQQINKIIKDREFKDELKVRGLKRAAEFSWTKTAVKTLAVIAKK